MNELDVHLGSYQPMMLSALHHRLSRHLLSWLMRHCTCALGAPRHARDAYFSAAYEVCCSPQDTEFAENLLSAKFVAVTLLADDSRNGREPSLSGTCRTAAWKTQMN